jgi:hypothetical protein
MDSTDWSALGRAVQTALEDLDFLIGSWEGEGHSHGEPIEGRLCIQRVAGGGFVQAQDQTIEGGRVTHEDLAIYRWDSPNESLRVHHYSPPGVVMDHYVLFDKQRGGIRWVSGPDAPRVELWPEGAELVMEVFLPGESAATQRMRYRRTDPE